MSEKKRRKKRKKRKKKRGRRVINVDKIPQTWKGQEDHGAKIT